ncbi:class I tRNA ligase family protein, partial [Sphingomonas sp.]|uniref:class I tRNA ligase family protein n=1 Tax=Sphingomonas sp. TaxID=28214 RepID=UPI003B3AF15B
GSTTLEPPKADLAINRWIIAQTVKTIQSLDLALADLRFDEAANTIYHFTWASFCDWYLELIKPVLSPLPLAGGVGGGESDQATFSTLGEEANPTRGQNESPAAVETRAVVGWVLDQILVMLHPFMPFITEELWHALADRPDDLIVGHWPMADARAIDPAASAEVEWLIKLVSEIRAARSELNVPPSARLNVLAHEADEETRERFRRNGPAISRMARLDVAAFTMSGLVVDLKTATTLPYDASVWPKANMLQVTIDGATYMLPVGDVLDLAAERARLAKGAEAAEKERDSLAGRLKNPAFVEKAKPEAVAKAREDHDAKAAEADRLRAALARLG